MNETPMREVVPRLLELRGVVSGVAAPPRWYLKTGPRGPALPVTKVGFTSLRRVRVVGVTAQVVLGGAPVPAQTRSPIAVVLVSHPISRMSGTNGRVPRNE